MALEVGSTLKGRYRILGELGRGGMGSVHRGFDERLEMEVAIKENAIASPESERQFKREAKLLARLQHSNLPRVTDHFVIQGQGQYLVMDFIQGETAAERLKSIGGPLPEPWVLEWAQAIISALDYLHDRPQPILHRDIKPSNIKITPEGRVVLVDFGLAKVEDPDKPTTLGAKAYTPGFAPPEQYGRGRTTVRTDIYALGATLYMLLTNQVPVDAMERTLESAQLVPIRELNPEVSAHVALAIEKAMALKPADRFGNVKEFEAALFQTGPAAAAEPGTTVVSSQAPTVVAPEPAKARGGFPLGLFVGGTALVALIVVALGGLLLWNRAGNRATPTASVSAPTTAAELAAADLATATPSPMPASPTMRSTATAEAVTVSSTPEPSATPSQPMVGGGSGQLAFVSDRAGLPQIFMINVDGSGLVQLTEQEGGACQPTWSADGGQLLFTSPCSAKRDFYPSGSIWVANPDGSEAQQLIARVGGAFDPDWNLAGIAFTSLEGGDPRVWLANTDGSNPAQITVGRSDDFQPSWSPDGTRLAFLNTSRAGIRTVFWMMSDGTFPGSNPDQVTRDKPVDNPAWSPLGDLVAYVSEARIWVTPWDGRGFGGERITDVPGNDDPAWSPDGQWFALESWVSEQTHDIYIMPASGGEKQQLTNDPALDFQPAWRP